MDKQKLICQGLWRKAGQTQEEVAIPCKTLADARRLRFALYNAVREFKDDPKTGREGKRADPDLQAGIENFSVSFHDEAPTTIVLRHKGSSTAMQAALAVLGDTPLLAPEGMEVAASIAAVQKKLEQMANETNADAPRVTPYYTR